jgi:hypothetical protein
MTYYVDGHAIIVQGWSMDPTKFQNDFWDNVRTWFNKQQQTSVIVAGIVHGAPAGKTLVGKLMGTDNFKKPVQQRVKLLVPQTPENPGIAGY